MALCHHADAAVKGKGCYLSQLTHLNNMVFNWRTAWFRFNATLFSLLVETLNYSLALSWSFYPLSQHNVIFLDTNKVITFFCSKESKMGMFIHPSILSTACLHSGWGWAGASLLADWGREPSSNLDWLPANCSQLALNPTVRFVKQLVWA